MGLLSRIASMFRSQPSKRRRVRAAYDAAQTTPENQRHWAWADALSANAANDPGTRQTLRIRSRYECANNSYAAGMLAALSHDLVGSGPRLQITTPDVPREAARQVEREFARWSRASNIADTLRILHETRIRDGEAFGVMISNPLLRHDVKLDVRLYEAEQVADPFYAGIDPLYTDGVRQDESGNPVEYTFLRNHPGGVNSWLSYDTVKIPAADVLHWFRPNRPGQSRGVPELTPALPLFALLRRYTLATVTAAEVAAMLAGVMETDTAATYSDASADNTASAAFDRVALERGTLLTLPTGWKATQFKPEQPHQLYEMFRDALLNEIGRALNVPFNIIAGNSSRYNYSSGRLDHLGYHRTAEVERGRMERRLIDRLFLSWLNEATLIPNLLPDGLPPFQALSWDWHWDGFASIDPQKEGNADSLALADGRTTLQAIYARDGYDWEEQIEQRGRELARLRELGILAATPSAAAQAEAQVDMEEETADA